MTTHPSPILSGGVLALLIYALLLAAFAAIFGEFFPLPGFRLGHDYALGLTAQLDGYFWFRNNGMAVPWFTPSFCAGQPYYADPQSTYYTVMQLLANLGNPVTANYVTLLLAVSLAYWGGYLLMRRVFGAGTPAAILVGGLLMFNGFLPYRMAIGHLGYHGFALLPWIALLLLMPLRQRVDGAVAGAAAGLLLAYWVHGGMGTLMIPAAMGVFIIALLHGLRGGALRHFFARAGVSILVALSISASKLIAAGAFMANFPRSHYPLPGVQTLWDAVIMVTSSLFLPSEQVQAIMTPRFANSMWALLPHEWTFGFTPAPAILLVVLAGLTIYRRQLALPRQPSRWGMAVLLAACLLWPMAYAIYEPSWNAFLKSLPVLGAASTPTRWIILYIPLVAVGAGLLVQRALGTERFRWLVAVCTLAGTATLSALEPRDFYLGQDYDARPVLLADAMTREGRLEPGIKSLGLRAAFRDGPFETTLALNDTFIAGVSQVFCYNPIFGYRLEKFSADGLAPGDVLQVRDGYLNLKNPACYVFPRENGCQPGDRFSVDQLAQARNFIAYRPFEFAMPRRQHLANEVTRWSLWLIGVLGVAWLAWRSARRFA